MKNIVVVDIDGLLAKMGARSEFLKEDPIDWSAFYDSDFNDKPIREMCELVSLLLQSDGHRVVFSTGRRESVRAETSNWLSRNTSGSTIGPLLMRPNDDLREDSVVKIEQFKKSGYLIEDIAFVLDDKSSVVEAWRNLGVLCLQVG